jgi:flagellar motor switch protein FliG
MTNEEKVAILLLSLEEDLAAKVIKNFRPSEIRRVGRYMSRITSISSETLNAVAREFCQLAKEHGGMIAVGDDMPKNIVIKAVGEKEAQEILEGVDSGRVLDNPIIDKLRDVDSKALIDFTRLEHPQTIALILAHLRPEQASEVLESFLPDMQFDIIRRMATLKNVPHEYIEEVARTLEKELVAGIPSDQPIGGTGMIAEILNRMNRSAESAIMAVIEDSDPALADQIRSLMFSFDDVLRLDDRSLQEILKEIGTEDLGKALKLVDEDMRETIYRNMSKRGAELLKEDIEMMPPIRLSEVELSQRKILDAVKRLESEGKIIILRSGEQDEFI